MSRLFFSVFGYVENFKKTDMVWLMECVFVKDSEGYVFRKPENEVSCDEKIISEKEYRRKSGLAMYEKKFGHGGPRDSLEQGWGD